jgi:3-hydroxymyristoyl/3-hydroxydecanoyl-(acyl carrier protein) dehydratase
MSPWHTCELSIPGDHPSAAGHFPGNPIVPGALLLDAAAVSIGVGQRPFIIRNAKFLRPVGYGMPLQLRWLEVGQEAGQAQFRFECLGADGPVFTGMLSTGPAA